ncbi:hypothetical protein OROMI_023151 [Orobanche minor]
MPFVAKQVQNHFENLKVKYKDWCWNNFKDKHRKYANKGLQHVNELEKLFARKSAHGERGFSTAMAGAMRVNGSVEGGEEESVGAINEMEIDANVVVVDKRKDACTTGEQYWDKFITHTQSAKFKGKTKLARKESLYQHRMGRGGYSALREKLVENKVIEKDEMPARSLMWYKACENKEGVLEDDNVKVIAHKLINDGEVKLDPGTDAMTLVFGKENGGFLKGVGTRVTATRYFHVPCNKGSAKEQIDELKIELHKGKREIEKKMMILR